MERAPSPRVQNLAVLLPLLGVFLLMPPFVTLFASEARPWGVPLVVAYVFGVWVVLLAAAALLSRVLVPADSRAAAQAPPADPAAADAPATRAPPGDGAPPA